MTSPSASTTAAAVQLGAWKKLVLVSLLTDGTVGPLPRYTSAGVGKAIKADGGAYRKLAEAFGRLVRAVGSRSPLSLLAAGGGGGASSTSSSASSPSLSDLLGPAELATLAADENVGLAERVLRALPAQRVRRQTEIFGRLALGELARRVGISEDEEGLLKELLVKLVRRSPLPPFLSRTCPPLARSHTALRLTSGRLFVTFAPLLSSPPPPPFCR